MLFSRYQRCWMVTVSITVILFHISRNNEGEEKAAATVLKDGASSFPGPKKGYYFGTGPKGLGYYKDRSKPNPNNDPLAAPSSSSSLSPPSSSSWALRGSSNKSGLIFVDLGKFRRHERNKNLKDGAAPSSSSVSSSLSIHFLSSHSFRGNKPGMYFGKGEKGVGYYPLLRIDRSNRPDSLSTTAMGGRKAATTTAIEKKTNADTEFQNHLVDGKSSNTCGDIVITYDDTEERKLLIEKYKQRLAKLDDENHKEDNNKLQRKMQLAERQTGSNQILRNGIKFPRSWEGFIEPEDALKQLRKHRGSDGMQKYRNLFIPLPVNMVPTFNGWMQGYYFGTGEYGTGYYRDFYQELLLLAKQQHLEKNGTIKTIEQLKLEQILNKGEAKIMGIGSKRFMNLDAAGNSVVHHAQTGGVCGTLPCNVQTIETTAPDGKKQLIVTGQYLSDEGVGLPMGPDKPEQGRIHPLANDVFDDVKALILKGDGTEQLNEDYYANQHDTRTPAQKKFDARWIRDAKRHRRDSDGGKSYRERLEAYNKRLAHMTDFNDLFKITERTEAMGWHSDRNGIQHLNAFGANEGDIYRIKPEKGATAR